MQGLAGCKVGLFFKMDYMTFLKGEHVNAKRSEPSTGGRDPGKLMRVDIERPLPPPLNIERQPPLNIERPPALNIERPAALNIERLPGLKILATIVN